jgi:hypothetical protein
VQLIFCRGDDCAIRSLPDERFQRVQSEILRLPGPDSNLGRAELLETDLHADHNVGTLARVISEKGPQDYRIGFQLVEYNRFEANTPVAVATFTLSELRRLDGHRFALKSADGKVQAELQLNVSSRR